MHTAAMGQGGQKTSAKAFSSQNPVMDRLPSHRGIATAGAATKPTNAPSAGSGHHQANTQTRSTRSEDAAVGAMEMLTTAGVVGVATPPGGNQSTNSASVTAATTRVTISMLEITFIHFRQHAPLVNLAALSASGHTNFGPAGQTVRKHRKTSKLLSL